LKLLIVLLLFTAAACSSDSGSSSTPQDAGSAATTAAPASGGGTETTQPSGTTVASTTTAAAGSNLDIDACALLTAAEISATTGVEFGDGTINETMTRDGQVVCDWLSTGSEFATAQVLVVGGDVFDSNQSSAEEVFGLTTNPVDVPGADRTYATAEGSIVAMDIHGKFVQVAYIPSGPGEVLDTTLALAEIAAGRMP
jgi:hypothetical protein